MTMRTKCIKITKENLAEAALEAGQILQNGGLVAFPTETVYGLGGDALQKEASAKIYTAKGRPSDNPLIVHISQASALSEIASPVPETAWKLAQAFWPGPLTMILNKKDCVPTETTGGLNTVAVRMPDHPVALALIEASSGFVAAPSANVSGRPSPTTADHVMQDLDGRIELVLDGGPCSVGLESTIVDLTEETPVILRPGYLTPEMLSAIIGEVIVDPALMQTDAGSRPKAPGMKYRHYAPRAQMILVKGSQSEVTQKIRSLIDQAHQTGKKVGVLCAQESKDSYPATVVKSLGSRTDEAQIARNLFARLREFDEEDVDVIYAEWFEAPGIGGAVMNRMLKAAGHQILQAQEE